MDRPIILYHNIYFFISELTMKKFGQRQEEARPAATRPQAKRLPRSMGPREPEFACGLPASRCKQTVAKERSRPKVPRLLVVHLCRSTSKLVSDADYDADPPISPRWPSPRSRAAGPPCARTCRLPPEGPGASPARSRGRPPAPRPCPRLTRCACGARSPAWSFP